MYYGRRIYCPQIRERKFPQSEKEVKEYYTTCNKWTFSSQMKGSPNPPPKL